MGAKNRSSNDERDIREVGRMGDFVAISVTVPSWAYAFIEGYAYIYKLPRSTALRKLLKLSYAYLRILYSQDTYEGEEKEKIGALLQAIKEKSQESKTF